MMGNQFNEIMQKLRAQRLRARRYTAMLLVLAMLTSLSVSWRLHQVGTALTTDNEYCCGMEEHVHTDDCYTEELVCGYEEGQPEDPDPAFSVDSEPTTEEPEAEPEEPEPEEIEPEVHHHTADCYETVLVEHKELTCGQEEHIHDDTCPVDPDTGDFLCGYEEHTHTDDCYTTETETEEKLVCGYEEGEVISDGTAADDGIAALEDTNTATSVAEDSSSEAVSEPVLHHHTEACYEKVLTCTIPEHTHTLECLADYSADVETDDDWEKYSVGLSDNWNEALLAVAKEQLGYKESEKNFQTDEALGDIIDVHHYTRYGAFYGNPYADWDVAFIAFCQHYAGIPKTEIPQRLGLEALRADMDAMGFAYLTEGEDAAYEAIPGDVVTYNKNGTADDETIGIVETVGDDSLTVISGAVEGAVAEVTVPFTDVTSTILVDQAYGDYVGEADPDEDADEDPDEDPDGSYDEEIKARPAMRRVTAVAQDGGSDAVVTNPDGSIELNENWITEVTVTKNNVEQSGNLELNDGDEIILKYAYTIPENTLPDNYTVTYQLPDGITLKSVANGYIERPHSNPKEYIGTYTISEEGKVTLEFYPDKVSKEASLPGDFYLRATVDASGADESGKIEIPIKDHTITVRKQYDLQIEKSGADPKVGDDGKTYIEYTVKVSSKKGYNQNITITDILNDSSDSSKKFYPGEYDQNSFTLEKVDKSGGETPINDPKPTFSTQKGASGKDCKSFEITNLEKLNAGESYVLTYKVKLGDLTNTDGKGEFMNYAKANDKKSSEVWKYFDKKIEKSQGYYDEANNVMKWTITVNNPLGMDLAGTKVEDSIQTTGAMLKGDVKIFEDKDGWNDDWEDCTGTGVTQKKDQSGFTFEFPKGSISKKYKFEYTTTVPEGTKVVENRATETPKGGDDGYVSDNSGSVTERNWTDWKEHVGAALDSEGKTAWKLGFDIPSTWAEHTITDTIQDVTSDNGATTYPDSHYALACELQNAIETNLKINRVSGGSLSYTDIMKEGSGIGLEIHYHDTTGKEVLKGDSSTKVKSFTITIKNNGYSGFTLTALELNPYYTHVDLTDVSADTDVKFGNTAAEQKKEVDYHKPSDKISLKKTAYDSNNYNSNDILHEIDYNGNPNAGTNIYYQLFLGIEQFTEDEITVTDRLPEGLVFDSGNTSALWDTKYYSREWVDDNWIRNHFETPTVSEDGRTITFKLKNLKNAKFKSDTQLKGIIIRYKVHVEDSAWDHADTLRKPYTNYAEWQGKNLHDETTVTVKRDNEDIIKKEGKQIENTTDVKYTIVVNPNGADLLEGHSGNVTLTDVMTVNEKGYTATLDESSIKVYKYPKDENPIPLGVNEYQYTVTKGGSDRDQTTLEFTLQNRTGYVIEYTYKTDAGLNKIKLSNSATLTGGWSSGGNTYLEERDSGATGGNSVLTVYKVDQQNYGVHLNGATFKFYKFDKDAGTWDAGTAVTTQADGKFQYSPESMLSGNVKPEYDTLYKLVEETAPAGYTKSDAEYYFIWLAKGKTNTDDAYQTAVGSHTPIGSSAVTYYKHGTSGTVYIPNKRDGLVIEKKWENKDGSEMTNPPVNAIKVQLWKFKKSMTKTDAEFDQEIELTKDNGWSVVLKNLDLDYYYYVKEITDLGENYTVSYGTTNEGRLTGTITITNRSTTDSPGYELPATGSTGTAPYTTAGAVLMGAALVGGYRRKRRQERRGE